ncbi:MAG: recombination protein O N-terminal domain-containing protein, partial [Deltaproteobacteria bacterium]|nr:recombination protein O N-terminal domain-containing protein [Deltaproteobacteria bacterium]
MAELLSTRAIVLRTSPFGESDLVVSLLTEQFGKRSAFAARARTANKKLRGGLRPLSLAVVHLKPR